MKSDVALPPITWLPEMPPELTVFFSAYADGRGISFVTEGAATPKQARQFAIAILQMADKFEEEYPHV
jgi:hypothetical protein